MYPVSWLRPSRPEKLVGWLQVRSCGVGSSGGFRIGATCSFAGVSCAASSGLAVVCVGSAPGSGVGALVAPPQPAAPRPSAANSAARHALRLPWRFSDETATSGRATPCDEQSACRDLCQALAQCDPTWVA